MISELTAQVFRRLFVHGLWIFLLLCVLGGLGGLASELSRSPFSLSLSATSLVFLGGLPELAFFLLPVSGLVALLWWGGAFRESRGWLALRIGGSGGRALLPAVGFFALLIAVCTLLTGSFLTEDGAGLRARALWEGAQPRAGEAVVLEEIMLLPHGVEGGSATDVSFAFGSPSVFGHAKRARLEKASIHLENGVFQTESEIPSTLSFSSLRVPLEEVGLAPVFRGSRSRAEELKRLTWPLMSVSLLLLSLPFVLAKRAAPVFGAWIGGWALIRLCDHRAEALGAVLSASLPACAAILCCVFVWLRWEDA